jgi:hypothetical protein
VPTLGAALDFAKLEARNVAIHNLSAAPSAPVKGQMYFDTPSNTLLWYDGTTWQSAKGGVGAPPDATATVKGVVQLAGDLTGTAAAPTVANGAITSAKIADGTITDIDVASPNVGGLAATPSLRTLGPSAQQAMPGNTSLDQVRVPQASLFMNNQKLTSVADPTAAQDAATKNYVDSQGTNLSWKAPVRAATTASITLSGTQTIDGQAVAVGDRVLVKNQTPQTQNGIYICQSGAWTRSPDASTWTQLVGAVVPVGSTFGTNYLSLWMCDAAITGGTIGTNNINFNPVPSKVVNGSASAPATVLGSGTRLDQLQPPTTFLSMSGQAISGLADPASAQDAATKNYVDAVATGLDAKQSVYCATTANITLSGGFPTIDNQTPIAGTRVLVKDQTTTSQNGIYIVQSGAWTRAPDADTWNELVSAFTFVEQGTQNGDSGWVCMADAGGTLGTTNILWTQFSGAGSITAGAGITKTGNTLAANPDGTTLDTAGAGSSLEVKPSGIGGTQLAVGAVDLSGAKAVVTGVLPVAKGGTSSTSSPGARTVLGAAGYYNNSATHGAGTTITIPQATHALNATRAIHVQVQDNATGNVELPDVSVAANGDVTITYAAAVAANSKLVTLVG